jgi:hypothetical protein
METHWINLGHFGLTSESWGYDLEKNKVGT